MNKLEHSPYSEYAENYCMKCEDLNAENGCNGTREEMEKCLDFRIKWVEFMKNAI